MVSGPRCSPATSRMFTSSRSTRISHMRVGSVATGVLPISRRQLPNDLQSPRLSLAPGHDRTVGTAPRAFPKCPQSALNYSTYLWRLARVHGVVSPTAAAGARMSRQAYRAPYTTDEMAALLEFAQSLTNEYRRKTLLTLVALGAGCGITRQRVRSVHASGVHLHGDAMFVKVGHCAKVRTAFADSSSLRAPSGPKELSFASERRTSPSAAPDGPRAVAVCPCSRPTGCAPRTSWH